jgi:hypothetical protein
MHLLLIRAKTVEVSYGEFFCTNCGRLTTYQHKQRVKQVLVFFIVPFLGEPIAEYVECQACKHRFPLDALRSQASPELIQILDTLKENLKAGSSMEETQSLLLDRGIDLPTVKRYVSIAAGISHKRCPRCDLRFRSDVFKCNKCGAGLR